MLWVEHYERFHTFWGKLKQQIVLHNDCKLLVSSWLFPSFIYPFSISLALLIELDEKK